MIGLVDVVDAIVREGDPLLPGVRPDPAEADPSKPVRYHYTLVDFLAEWRAGEARAGGDAAEVVWADPEELTPYGLWGETLRLIRLGLAQCR